ncbi:nucleotidyl transferase AbiEii/AbiGii toxin family protein [Flavobacterium haoranii]|uniref:Nucleotidyl transferase AbiEii toxin, Type IV TA system n=1 Tax=Flavobacterium haoranii TaxID=683124 RepID=A0A1M6C100_9FLAO|nr:nucleotidyl transferase AbiEii/AbiGii toxin family protein [Flavobacterium haoranii]SHI54696.1 Nucleotidyl transferase AbiEii toxin, Type IV TA system [Flavobacterium haoranii]
MNYKIESQKIEHPLLKPLLAELIPFFEERGISFFVIGATARDIILEISGQQSGRRTQDIDIAISIDKWEQFEEIANELINLENFSKDPQQQQRFLYLNKFQIDIVPFGNIMDEHDKIYWPPDQTFAMNVLGFEEAKNETVTITLDEEIQFEIVNLISIFLLKIVAWKDRHHRGNKDADDIAFIMQNYLNINDERAATEHYDDVYGIDNYTELKASASLIGIDLRELVNENPKLKEFLINELNKDIEKQEASILINQILETHKTLQYEDVLESIKIIKQQLSK